jgi:hypothetical protein
VRAERWTEAGLVAGLGLTIFGTAVVAGLAPFQGMEERYGLFLCVPIALAIAVLVDALALPGRRAPLWIGAGLGGLGLLGVGSCFFGGLASTGGEGQGSFRYEFRTGPVEPKQAAWVAIRADRRADEPIRILTGGWGIAQPLRYWAARDPLIVVDSPEPMGAPPLRTYVVELAGEAPSGTAARFPGAQLIASPADPQGRPILRVWRIADGRALSPE